MKSPFNRLVRLMQRPEAVMGFASIAAIVAVMLLWSPAQTTANAKLEVQRQDNLVQAHQHWGQAKVGTITHVGKPRSGGYSFGQVVDIDFVFSDGVEYLALNSVTVTHDEAGVRQDSQVLFWWYNTKSDPSHRFDHTPNGLYLAAFNAPESATPWAYYESARSANGHETFAEVWHLWFGNALGRAVVAGWSIMFAVWFIAAWQYQPHPYSRPTSTALMADGLPA